MALMESLVIQLMILLLNDICDSESISWDMRDPAWRRRKNSKIALEIILDRWCDDGHPIPKLVAELLWLQTPDRWDQWISESEHHRIRVDLWKTWKEGERNMSQSKVSEPKLALLALWIGNGKAEPDTPNLYPSHR
jgi:hypothetical protein